MRNKCCPGSNETIMIGDFARPPGPPRNHELDFRYDAENLKQRNLRWILKKRFASSKSVMVATNSAPNFDWIF